MYITLTGYWIILLIILTAVYSYKSLYFLLLFSIHFSATSVFAFSSSGSSIQPFMLLVILYSVLNFTSLKSTNSFSNIIPPDLKVFRLYFHSFMIIAFMSILMPLYIDGTHYGNTLGRLGERNPIIFTYRNITQFIYLIIGYLLLVSIGSSRRRGIKIEKTIKIYAYSNVFVVVWGFFQVLCYKFHLVYPYFIFNNSPNPSVYSGSIIKLIDGYEQLVNTITSVAAEPSILAQTLLIIYPYLFFSLIYRKYIFSMTADILLLFASVALPLLAGSSTALIAVLLTSLLVALFIVTERSNISPRRKTLFFIAVFALGSMSLTLFYSELNSMLFQKSQSFSAIDRLDGIIGALENFTAYPLFGVGWGSITNTSLPLYLLGSTGILGSFLFASSMIVLLKGLLKSRSLERIRDGSSLYSNSAFVSLLVTLITATVSNWSYVYGFFWLSLGLAVTTLTHINSDHTRLIGNQTT
jgi:hypothetical protein